VGDDLWRITWLGDGVRSNEAGTFGKWTTAFVKESIARKVMGEEGWQVVDPSGKEHGPGSATAAKPAPAKPHAEKPADKPAPAKAAEKPADKAGAKEISLDDEESRKELRERAMAILADEDEKPPAEPENEKKS
jgi:hypothetical protein